MYGSKCSPRNSSRQLAIVEGIAEENSVFIVITSAKILPRWLFPSKIYIQLAIFNTYFSAKLSFTNKRYKPVWIGTIRLEIKKTKWEEKKTDIESDDSDGDVDEEEWENDSEDEV